MFLFFVTVAFSAFYMIGRLVQISLNANAFVLVFLGFIAVVLLFSLWSASLFVLQMILQRFIPQSQVKSKLRQILQGINDRVIVRGVASTLFGVDTTDSEGGEVIHVHDEIGERKTNSNVKAVSNDELMAHVEKLEGLLTGALDKREIT
jgi:hypothetical protein